MLEYIKFKKNKKINFEQYVEYFYQQPFHKWIIDNKSIKRVFDLVFSVLDENSKGLMLKQNKIIVIPTNGTLACSISGLDENFNIILAFPDMIKLLKSAAPDLATAIILHEIGHIILEHAKKNISNLAAQFEADEFATKLGFGYELIKVMEDFPDSLDCMLRIELIKKQLINH